jgi:hypothetical protein
MRAGAAAQAVGDEILKDLSTDPSGDPKNKPDVQVSMVMTSRTRWLRSVELTGSARVKLSHTDVVKQKAAG